MLQRNCCGQGSDALGRRNMCLKRGETSAVLHPFQTTRVGGAKVCECNRAAESYIEERADGEQIGRGLRAATHNVHALECELRHGLRHVPAEALRDVLHQRHGKWLHRLICDPTALSPALGRAFVRRRQVAGDVGRRPQRARAPQMSWHIARLLDKRLREGRRVRKALVEAAAYDATHGEAIRDGGIAGLAWKEGLIVGWYRSAQFPSSGTGRDQYIGKHYMLQTMHYTVTFDFPIWGASLLDWRVMLVKMADRVTAITAPASENLVSLYPYSQTNNGTGSVKMIEDPKGRMDPDFGRFIWTKKVPCHADSMNFGIQGGSFDTVTSQMSASNGFLIANYAAPLGRRTKMDFTIAYKKDVYDDGVTTGVEMNIPRTVSLSTSTTVLASHRVIRRSCQRASSTTS
ncbi:hypothetical protein T492DRAFT_840240 [Pavlovales sp. CCMP2436]|nr:hypothetical protein T492DRAFT_840240 [Pavlovales sp. CCMP2436]